jgi:hypothetical protein
LYFYLTKEADDLDEFFCYSGAARVILQCYPAHEAELCPVAGEQRLSMCAQPSDKGVLSVIPVWGISHHDFYWHKEYIQGPTLV